VKTVLLYVTHHVFCSRPCIPENLMMTLCHTKEADIKTELKNVPVDLMVDILLCIKFTDFK
jgi:hypothetical protein